jgi:hypothetical protein
LVGICIENAAFQCGASWKVSHNSICQIFLRPHCRRTEQQCDDYGCVFHGRTPVRARDISWRHHSEKYRHPRIQGTLSCGYFPTEYLPIGAATGGGGSLRRKSAAPAALSTVNNPTVMLNTAMNAAVLNTAKNAVVTTLMSFFTLIPLVCRALGRATEGRRYSPPAVERFPPLHIFDPSQNTTSRATKFLTKG